MSLQTYSAKKTSRHSGIALLLLCSALLASNGCNQSENEHVTPPPGGERTDVQLVNSAETKTPNEVLNAVESLLAPIALYPDPLLAEVLIAATYPAEIRLAARRLEIGPARESAGGKNWNASLLRLTHFPSVIIMLNEHPQWTAALGDAFLAAPEAVLQAVQALRRRAVQAGFLKDSAALKVLLKTASAGAEMTASAPPAKRDGIIILPADAEKIHMPLYNPQTVFSAVLAAPPEDKAKIIAAPQPALSDEAAMGAGNDYYPANYPVDSISRESGSAYLAFGAGIVVPGLLTWGNIVWDGGRGYSIAHPYGQLTDCSRAEDCWMRSSNQGYHYANSAAGSLVQDANSASPASEGQIAFGIPWHHDPRHRRGVFYSANAAQPLRELKLPPLAGQRLNGPPLPLPERGFAASLTTDDTETESAAGAHHYAPMVIYSVFSGISRSEAGDDEALQRGKASRIRNKIATKVKTGGHTSDSRRTARKPSPQQAVQSEALRALLIEQLRREMTLPSVFAADFDTARLVAYFRRRGAESRAHQRASTDAAKTSSNRTPEEGD